MEENNVGIPSADETPNLDRGELIVSGRAKKKNVIAIVVLVVFALIVIAIGVTIAINRFTNAKEETTTVETTSVGQADVSGVEKGTVGNDAAWFDEVKRQREKEKAQEKRALERARQRQLEEAQAKASHEQEKITVPTNDVPTPTVETSSSHRSSRRDKNAPPTPQERRLMAGLMVSVSDKSSSSQSTPTPPKSHDTSYDAPTFALGSATKRQAGQLDFLLKHGSVIPCALYSQIISDYQGIVMCRVTQDIYSANGKALLVERGSLLTGSQNVELEPGKSRVFTTWADIETPNGISIRIDSLGAGRLGASGNEAWVDNHFKERFGGAILLSFIDDAFEALANKTSSSDSDISFDNSTDNATDMAEKALDASINISPTGYTQIGQRINIIVARDIDMSSVYAFQ